MNHESNISSDGQATESSEVFLGVPAHKKTSKLKRWGFIAAVIVILLLGFSSFFVVFLVGLVF